MEFSNLGKAGLTVSRLCLGTMIFGSTVDESKSISLVHKAIDDGINFIDTANGYNNGLTETILGKALQGRRNEVVLTTKVNASMGPGPNSGGLSRYHIFQEIENSLKRLQTDRIDLYMLHRPDTSTPLEESIGALSDLVTQGKVRYVGMSNHPAWQVCSAMWMSELKNMAKVVCVQDMYNIVNRDIEVELLPFCQSYGIGVMAYSPLARGVMTGKYLPNKPIPEDSRAARGDQRILESEMREDSFVVANKILQMSSDIGRTVSQIALNWVIRNKLITSAVIGPRTLQQYEDNLAALNWDLDIDLLDQIDSLVPPGEHTGSGYNDPLNTVKGRVLVT